MNDKKSYIFPNEPLRFNSPDLERLVVFCQKLGASDITLQTGESYRIPKWAKCSTQFMDPMAPPKF